MGLFLSVVLCSGRAAPVIYTNEYCIQPIGAYHFVCRQIRRQLSPFLVLKQSAHTHSLHASKLVTKLPPYP
jgi:hypothetical protein